MLSRSQTSVVERNCFRTFWQTTHNGKPMGSSNSPGPRGIVTSPTPAPPESVCVLLLVSQACVTSSKVLLQSSSKLVKIPRTSRTQVFISRVQSQGLDQSSKMTMRVSGRVAAVNRGRRSGMNDGVGSEIRYTPSRASTSIVHHN
jgi:hypothetical protein